jgi:hypothetical protein
LASTTFACSSKTISAFSNNSRGHAFQGIGLFPQREKYFVFLL